MKDNFGGESERLVRLLYAESGKAPTKKAVIAEGIFKVKKRADVMLEIWG